MFVICNHCHRHIRHTESTCPFCSTSASEHSSRYGVGLAVALTVASALGCSGEIGGGGLSLYAGPPTGGTASQGGAGTQGGSSAQGGTSQTTTVKGTGGGMIALYAGPPTGGTSAKSSNTGGANMVASYGPPPAPGVNS